MGDPESNYIFSIDPGIVNIGAACYNGKTGEILFANKLAIAPSLKAMANDAEYVPRIFKLFFSKESPYRKMMNHSKIVLIEIQMKARIKIVQHVIAALCFNNNINYEFVAPQLIKNHFNTGAKARAKQGVVLKGKKTNHGANKKMGIEKAKELFPDFMKKLSASKQDDVADALLQAVWYSQKGKTVIDKRNAALQKKRANPTPAAPKKKTKKRKK